MYLESILFVKLTFWTFGYTILNISFLQNILKDNMTDYKKLFSEIKESRFVKKIYTPTGIVETYYSSQENMNMGKQTLVRCLKKNGRGKEFLYSADGKPILDVNLRCGKPHGRAKMYDDEGFFSHNTYWYYGEEVNSFWSLDYFCKTYEDTERKIPKENRRAREKVYETTDFYMALDGCATLEGIRKPNFKLLAKMRRENMR